MTESVVISFFSGFQHREKLLLNVLVRQGEKVHFFFQHWTRLLSSSPASLKV